MLSCKLPIVNVHSCTCKHIRVERAIVLLWQPDLLYLSCNLYLQEGDCTRPTYVQKSLTLRIPNNMALPALGQYSEDLDRLRQEQDGNGLLIPVWLMLQFNDGQEFGPIRVNVAVQTQKRANSGYKFLVCGLHKVFSDMSQDKLKDFKATCWQLQIPSLFCRIRCTETDAEAVQATVQRLQQDTAGFNMLQLPFYDFQV